MGRYLDPTRPTNVAHAAGNDGTRSGQGNSGATDCSTQGRRVGRGHENGTQGWVAGAQEALTRSKQGYAPVMESRGA